MLETEVLASGAPGPSVAAIIDSYPVMDGFCYRRSFKCDFTFQSLAVQRLEALRRATGYKTKVWLAPAGASITIPARQSMEFQVEVGVGAVIWSYVMGGLAAGSIEAGAAVISVQVRDACDDLLLFQEPVTRQGQAPAPQQFLTIPLIVGAPGLLNVEIHNQYDSAQLFQLALYGGQPQGL